MTDSTLDPDISRDQRLTEILNLLSQRGALTIHEITSAFGISPATARRDLDLLEQRRLLHRTHGGATPASTVDYQLTARMQPGSMAAEIEAIAAAAVELVTPGMCVGLSGGRTSTALAKQFAASDRFSSAGLTVVTNAINIAQLLVVRPYIRVVVTGGIVRKGSFELAGPFSDLVLEQIALDMAFIGANGVDAEIGPTVTEDVEAPINRLMAERAREAWIIADSSKIGKRAFAVVSSPESFSGLITDSGIAAADREALTAHGLKVVTV